MKTRLLLICLLAIVTASCTTRYARAQGGAISGQALQPPPPTGNGGVAPYATIRVCGYTGSIGVPCNNLSNLYSDQALTQAISNPMTADQYGNWTAFVAQGSYLLQTVPIGSSGPTYSVYVFSNGSASVSSVGLSLPSVFNVSGSPVTGSGTLTAVFATASANLFLATPSTSSGQPSLRAITSADLPNPFGSLTIDGTLTTTAPGNTSIGGTLGVTGATLLSSTLGVTGATNLTSAALSTTLNVTGASTLTSVSATTLSTTTLSTSGLASLNSLSLGGSQTVTGLQGTAGTKLATSSGSYTNNDFAAFNATGDIVDSLIPIASPVRTVCATAGASPVFPSTTSPTATQSCLLSSSINSAGKSFRISSDVFITPASAGANGIYWGMGTTSTLGSYSNAIVYSNSSTGEWETLLSITCTVLTPGSTGQVKCTPEATFGVVSGSATLTQNFPVGFNAVVPINLTGNVYVGIACSFGTANSSNSCSNGQFTVEQLN